MSRMKTPRPHQIEAIDAVVKGFKSHRHGKLIMACGTGKTLIAGWVREKLKAGCTLFMAPSNALLAQTLQAWREVSAHPFEAMAVCSDKTVADGRADEDEDMRASEVGTAVTTNYQDIATFISSSGRRVVFCTYQSSEAVAAAMSLVSVPEFDLVVADEAHRTTGGADHVFPTVVHPEKIRSKKKLFMTATPKFYFDDAEVELASMDNEELYGPVFHELDFAEAIKRKLLTDYEILVVGIAEEATKEAEALLQMNPHLKVGDRRMMAKDLAVHIAIMRAIKERNLRRVITFHSSCPRAAATADFLPQLQDWMPKKHRTDSKVWSRTVNYHLDLAERHELLREFAALEGPGVLTNARCLGEGVDVPTVDGIAFMDAKKSKIEIAQAVGRAIRLAPNKETAYIILPVILEADAATGEINDRGFRPVLDVINALRAHDSTLMDEMMHWRDARNNAEGDSVGGHGDNQHRITLDIPEDCDPKIADWFVTRLLGQSTNCALWCKEALKKDTLSAREAAYARILFSRLNANGLHPEAAKLIPLVLAKFGLVIRKRGIDHTVQEMLAFCRSHGHQPERLSPLSARWRGIMIRVRKGLVRELPKAITDEVANTTLYARWLKIQRDLQLAAKVDAYVAEFGYRPPTQTKLGDKFSHAIVHGRQRKSFVESVGEEWFTRTMRLKTAKQVAFVRDRQQTVAGVEEYIEKHGHRPSSGSELGLKFARMLGKGMRNAAVEAVGSSRLDGILAVKTAYTIAAANCSRHKKDKNA